MTNIEDATLTRKQIREIFERNRGAQIEVARDLGIAHVNVSKWLRGKQTSARIAEAAHRKALQLLDQEARTKR